MLWKNPLRCTIGAPGQIEIAARVCRQQRGAEPAYTPGVAKPCLEIQKDINKEL